MAPSSGLSVATSVVQREACSLIGEILRTSNLKKKKNLLGVARGNRTCVCVSEGSSTSCDRALTRHAGSINRLSQDGETRSAKLGQRETNKQLQQQASARPAAVNVCARSSPSAC